MSAPVGWSVHGGESPVLDNQAVLKPEDVEEHVSSGSLPLSLGNDVGAILECPYHGQLQLVTRRLIDELRQPFHTVSRVRIVLHKSLVVDVLRRKVYIPALMPWNIVRTFSMSVFATVNSPSLLEMSGFLEGEPRIARKY